MAHDLVIKNGTVVDGTGSAGFAADVAVDGDKISAIGKNLGAGKKEIDAKGHVVAPGFIDSHTHMDAFVVQYPNGNPVVNYGVTSIVIGDCGASCAPVPPKPEPRKVLVQYLRRVLDKYVDDKDWRWNTFGEYLNYLEGKVAINCLPLMPHSPVRLDGHGRSRLQRAANPEELDAMKKMVREGMELGAIGFSTSPRGGPAIHAGTPSTFAEHDEIIELANVTDEYNGCFQFNGFQMMLQPESGVPEMLTKIHGAADRQRISCSPRRESRGDGVDQIHGRGAERGQDILRSRDSLSAYSPLQFRRLLSLQRPADLGSDQELQPTQDQAQRQGDPPKDRTRTHRLRRQARISRMAWLGSRHVRASGKTGFEKTRTKKRRRDRPPHRKSPGGCLLRHLARRQFQARASATMA